VIVRIVAYLATVYFPLPATLYSLTSEGLLFPLHCFYARLKAWAVGIVAGGDSGSVGFVFQLFYGIAS
jgi:hypothetical protein